MKNKINIFICILYCYGLIECKTSILSIGGHLPQRWVCLRALLAKGNFCIS